MKISAEKMQDVRKAVVQLEASLEELHVIVEDYKLEKAVMRTRGYKPMLRTRASLLRARALGVVAQGYVTISRAALDHHTATLSYEI